MGTTLAAVIFLVAGAASSVSAVALARREVRFRRRAARAAGVIRERKVDSVPNPDGGTSQLVTVTVEFDDATGTRVCATAPVVTGTSLSWRPRAAAERRLFGPPDYAVGDVVPLWYDPDRPENIRIDSWLNRWFGVLVMGILGVGFTIVGLVILTGVHP